MKHSLRSLLFLGAASALLAFGARAEPEVKRFRYLAEALPKDGLSCAERANRLAETFRAQTGVPMAHGRCLKESATAANVEVTYLATQRLDPNSTIEYSVGIPSSYQGSYSTAAACDADLPRQTRLFRDHTGLEPLVAYCYRESKDARNAHVLRIDAFGKPIHAPRIRGMLLFGHAVGDADSLQKRISAYFEAHLETLSSAVLRSYVLDEEVRIVYYGEKARPLRSEELGTFPDRDRCLRAWRSVEAHLAGWAVPPPLFCVDRRLVGRYSLQLLQLREGDYLRPIPYSQAFGDYPSCEAHASQALAESAEAFGGQGFAAVCHGDPRDVRMNVLLRGN